MDSEILLRSVGAAMLGRPDSELARAIEGGLDHSAFLDLAWRNKLVALAAAGLRLSLKSLPEALDAEVRSYQAVTMRRNTANLMTIRHVTPLLESRGVKVLVFKGPLQQQRLYGNYFIKPSGDVDLLVAPADYDRASEILRSNGYSLPQQCATPWWRHFLGEQPFLSEDQAKVIVDLHHKTQQPGCPSPRRPDEFLDDREYAAIGEVQIPTLSRPKAALLACMNLAKAMTHREHAGGYVADVAAFVRSAQPGELAQLVGKAEEQGLRNTVGLGLRCAEALFGREFSTTGALADSSFSAIDDGQLTQMALLASPEGISWSKRRRLLWNLCDSKSDYPREMSWALGAELFRRVYEQRTARN